ncbi:GIY-YIG nuclease family protein [Candidatus Woesebacteria bacterium]|nr:GIY-YIG nuclease family protein [Candidatus Woesebacteria bacterium]
MYYTYILIYSETSRYYIGSTTNLKNHFKKYTSGKCYL